MPSPSPQFSRLVINTVIIHEIPQAPAAEKAEHLVMSGGAAPVGDRELNFFRERVTQSIDSHGVASRFSDATQSPVPDAVVELLQGGDVQLVSQSQTVAMYLYEQQPGNSPEGLLVVMLGSIDGDPSVAVMKLQKLAGLRVADALTPEGEHTLTVEILNELMLTDRTRVFKVGVFVKDQAEVIHGMVSDEQLGSNAAGGVAAFFMNVLGCIPAKSPAVLTKRFHDVVHGFINDKVSNPETKLRYADALRAELASHAGSIEPATFIQRHIDPGHRDPIEVYLRDGDVPLRAFQKDTQGIEARIRRRYLKTQRGITIRADADTFAEYVTVEELDGERVVVVRDSVSEV